MPPPETAMTSRRPIRNLALPCALLALGIFFFLREPLFLSPRNLTQLLVEFSIAGTLALGAFLVLLTGQIDLSIGSGVGLIGGVAAVLVFQHGWPAPGALALAFAGAVVLWSLMGALIVRQRIPAFIITLGGLLVFKGLFWLVIRNSTVPVTRGDEENAYSLLTTFYLPPGLGWALAAALAAVAAWRTWRMPGPARGQWPAAAAAGLGLTALCNQFRGIPLTLLILASAAGLAHALTRHTRFGRHLYAIGGNEEAAALSGIDVPRVMIGAYVLMGVAVALTGFMTTAFSGASTTTVGDLMELDAIAACVIGGTALRGGRGSVGGVLAGTLIMATLLNGMTLLAVAPEAKFIARGTVLALAVWLDVTLARRAAARA